MAADTRIAELEELVTQLRAQVEAALAQNEALLGRVQEFEARLAKDSHTSSKPPSSDPLGGKRPRSQRRRSGKKPGGQRGHAGQTLHLVASPDELVEQRPAVCTSCQMPLDETASVEGDERRQTHELPPVRLLIREQRALPVRCASCEPVSVGSFPAEASSRAQYGPRRRGLAVYLVEQQLIPYARVRELLADLLGAHLSLGTLTGWVQQGAQGLRPVEEQIKAALARAPVLHRDETGERRAGAGRAPGGRRAGTLAWAQVSGTTRLRHDAIHAKRGCEATDAIGSLPTYRGVSVHDGWKPSRHSTACPHALCTIPHLIPQLRELTLVEEPYQQTGAKELKALLLAMKAAVEQARTRGEPRVPDVERPGFVRRYDDLMAAGLAANPPPPERHPGHRGRRKHSPARNRLERLWLGQEEVLAFLDDFTIPFDTNQAEQDLRMLKVEQTMAGSFRAARGSEAFARIRGDLSWMRKQGVALLAALQSVFSGQPLYPALG